MKLGAQSSGRRGLLIAGVVAVAASAFIAVALQARASSTFTLTPASVANDLEIGSSNYPTVRDAINTAITNQSALSLPVPIPDMQSLSVTGLQNFSDDTKHALAIDGTVSIQSQSVNLQLSAVWPDNTSTTPQLALAVKPSAASLSALNALWSGAPFNPTLVNPVVIASPSASYVFDPTTLPSGAASFFPAGTGTPAIGHGLALIATVDASSDATLSKALKFLGEGTTVGITGVVSGSIAPLFGGTLTQVQQSGLDLTITDNTVGGTLPSWITARQSKLELQLVSSGGSLTAAVQLTDTMTTNFNGKTNTFTGTAAFSTAGFGSTTASLTYGLKPGTTLQAPFGLDGLTLASPQLQLSLTSTTFSGVFEADVTVSAHTVHVDAAVSISGSNVNASLSLTGSVTSADIVAFANSLLGTSIDGSSLGNAFTLTGVTFSFTKSGSSHTFSLDATAAIRSTLTADVLVSLENGGGTDHLIFGLHVYDASCSCIKVSDLVGGQLSSLASGLQFPAVDVMASVGFGSGAHVIDPSTLPTTVQNFLKKVYTTLPTAITLEPGLTFAGNVTLPDAVTSAFGMASGAQIALSGDVGVNLGAFSGSSKPALSGSLTAVLPAMTASLPSWLGGAASITWSVTLSADSSQTVQLEVMADSTITANIGGTAYPITVSGDIITGTGGTSMTLTGTATGTFTDLFGVSWLSVTNPSASLTFDTAKSKTSFTAELDATVTIAGKSAQVTAAIADSGGTDASLEVKLLDPVSLSDVASAFGTDLSTSLSSLPSFTITSLDAKFASGASGATFDLLATTTLVTHSGHSINSTILVSVSPGKVLAGIASTSNVKLSDIVATLPSGVDFTLPNFAVVVANPAQTLHFATMTPQQSTFFNAYCGDMSSPCHSSLALPAGVTIVATTDIPTALTGLLDQVHSDSTGPVLVTGTLPIFGGNLSTFSLTVSLPAIPATAATADFFESGDVSLSVTSSSLSLNGSITFNIPKGSSVSTQASCLNLSGIWRQERGTAPAVFGCFDQVPFDLTATMTLSPVPSMTLTGGLHQGYQWVAPMGQSWLTLNDATAQFGVEMTVPGPTFTLGFDIGFTISGHDFFGAILASITPLPAPPFIAIDIQGFRVASNSGLSVADLVNVASSVTGQSLSLGGIPNIAIRKIDFGFSQVNDAALCLTQGIHIAADVYINPTAAVTNTTGGGCPTDPATETSRAAQCSADSANGCFAAADFTIDNSGIRASGVLGGFVVGPLNFSGAFLDLTVSSTVQRLILHGGMTITDFASGNIDLLVSSSDLHFRGQVNIFNGAFAAFLDGDAAFSLTDLASLKNPPSFSVHAVLKSNFLNQAGVAISGTLQVLKPAIQAIDVVLTDITNGDLLGAIVDLPLQVANMGTTLPDPYGTVISEISSKLSDIKSAVSTFGHAVSYGINDVLNGFTLSFPGLPGTYVPSSPTCVTTESGGNCYSIPPVCFGLLGCTDGVPGFWVYPTCVTTVVNGTCYSIPPITGLHIPGLCDLIKSSVPQIVNGQGNCDINLLVPNLIDPALKAAFKAVTGYDMGNATLSSTLDSISSALGSGNLFAINCAEFSAAVQASSSPTASVSLATDVNLFGHDYNFGIGWNFSPNTSSVPAAIISIIQSIISPSTGVTCGLPADWNTNANYPDALGTGPTPTNDSGNPPPATPDLKLSLVNGSINEGSSATVNGTITPVPADGTSVAVDWGDNSTPVTVTTTAGAFTAQRTFVNNTPTGHAAAQYVVKATQSPSGPSGSTVLTVSNVAPFNLTLNTGTTTVVNEGSPITLNGSFNDPGADVHTVLITWGDGQTDTVSLGTGVLTFSKAHTYADNNGALAGYPVSVKVTDDDLASTTTATTINVNNVAPSGIGVTPTGCLLPPLYTVTCPTPFSSAQENAKLTYSITFTDPGVLDTETALINWGDGHTDTVAAGTNRTFTASHQWSEGDVNPHASTPPAGIFAVSVKITDKDGGIGTASTSQTIANAAPNGLVENLSSPCPVPNLIGVACNATAEVLSSLCPVGTATGTACINEKDPAISVYGVFTDASGSDTHTVLIDWGTGWGLTRFSTLQLSAGVFSYVATRQYGDDGAYPIVVQVSDDDGAAVSTSQTLLVKNINPTAGIDRSTAVTVKGVPTFFGHAGASVPFAENTYDPGSDDENILWAWGDGATTSTNYLNSPPATDPVLSPQVNARLITDQQAHAWQNACVYANSLTATDDDLGVGTDGAPVVITGNTATVLADPYWRVQYQIKPGSPRVDPPKLPAATLNCYLTIARYMSGVLGSARPLATGQDALNVLWPNNGDARGALDKSLLTAWLDFANGSFNWSTPLDTSDFDALTPGETAVPTMAFHDLMSTAESVRNNPASTSQQLAAQGHILDRMLGNVPLGFWPWA